MRAEIDTFIESCRPGGFDGRRRLAVVSCRPLRQATFVSRRLDDYAGAEEVTGLGKQEEKGEAGWLARLRW